MKKVFFIVSAIVMMACFTGCNNKNKDNASTDNDNVFAFKSIVIEKMDSVRNVSFKLAADVPTHGSKGLTDAINRGIVTHMGADSSFIAGDDLEVIAERFVKESADEIVEFGLDKDSIYPVSYSFEGKVKIEENTDGYVTYKYDTYIYRGGAHGLPERGYFTIDKGSNGVLTFDDVFVKGRENDIKEIIKKNLNEQYYKEEHEWDDLFSFELPSQEPGITADGVVIYYGAYEIDCYAAGTPFCVIPYEEINDMLTERVKNLIKQ